MYVDTIHHTIEFIEKEMMSKEGGFYSALDADSEGLEGKFYTWDKKEIEVLLGNNSALFCDFYGVTEKGNWEHTNILWITQPIEKFAIERTIHVDELKNIFQKCKEQLIQQREQRVYPGLDDKILLGWNALMNIAYSKAFAATQQEKYRQKSIQHMQFLEKIFLASNGSWYHTYTNGVAKIDAFLDDLSYLIQAYIQLQEITGNQQYVQKAKQLTACVIQHFSEEETGFFYYTPINQKDVIIRKKEVHDGATPSGNALMMHNLYYLGVVLDIPEWKQRVEKVVQHLGMVIIKYPTSFAVWASLIQNIAYGIVEIAIVGQESNIKRDELLSYYIPHKIVQSSNQSLQEYPLLKNRHATNKTLFFICINDACLRPVENVQQAIINLDMASKDHSTNHQINN